MFIRAKVCIKSWSSSKTGSLLNTLAILTAQRTCSRCIFSQRCSVSVLTHSMCLNLSVRACSRNHAVLICCLPALAKLHQQVFRILLCFRSYLEGIAWEAVSCFSPRACWVQCVPLPARVGLTQPESLGWGEHCGYTSLSWSHTDTQLETCSYEAVGGFRGLHSCATSTE